MNFIWKIKRYVYEFIFMIIVISPIIEQQGASTLKQKYRNSYASKNQWNKGSISILPFTKTSSKRSFHKHSETRGMKGIHMYDDA